MHVSDPHGPILVSGATGFVGEHLARRLAATNATVVGMGFQRSLEVPGVQMVRLDMRQSRDVRRCLRDLRPGIVFHCAAETDVAVCQRDPAIAQGHIIDTTCHLTRAANEFVPEAVLIALSTDLVFDGEHPPYCEQDRALPVNVYGRLKLESERHVLSLRRGMVMRTSLVYGPRTTHKSSFLSWMVDALSQRQPLRLFEDEVRTPIFVQDLCDAMIAMAVAGQAGLWHAGGPERLNRVMIGQALGSALGIADRGLIEPQRLSDSTYPAPRPRDVSLTSNRLWALLGKKPQAFTDVIKQVTGWDH